MFDLDERLHAVAWDGLVWIDGLQVGT